MYKNYIFDLYGTLVDIHTNERKQYLWQKTSELFQCYGVSYTPSELKKAFFQTISCIEKEQADPYYELEMESVFMKLAEKKQVTIDFSCAKNLCYFFRVISRQHLALYPEVFTLLKTLKENNRNVYLLSNAQASFTRPEIEQLGLFPYFDDILISSEEHCKKPSTDFMNCLLKRHHLKTEESIMVGNDCSTDIKIANDCGMDSVYIHSNISPALPETIPATYTILDNDIMKIWTLTSQSK
ncbi:MAG: HAD family hydrolase [Clostridiales bacterium]|nr:HAD family hydrolase [Clostridiales bacterium]